MFNEADKNVRKELSNITIDISIEHYRFFFGCLDSNMTFIESNQKKNSFFCEIFFPVKKPKKSIIFFQM